MTARCRVSRCARKRDKLIEDWSGRAAADDVGYRLVRAMRLQIRKDVFESLTATARSTLSGDEIRAVGAVRRAAVATRDAASGASARSALRLVGGGAARLASIARSQSLHKECDELQSLHLGRRRTRCTCDIRCRRRCRSSAAGSTCRRSRCRAIQHMPRVQGPAFGASQRLVVSPGHEAQGYFQMPGGPVDHPLSPFYGAGHDAWARGKPTPLLPGAERTSLRSAAA